MVEVELVVGPPACGKTTYTKAKFPDHIRLNRDELGGTIAGLLPRLEASLSAGQSVVLDNLFSTASDRKPFINLAKKCGAIVNCTFIDADINDCLTNACVRMFKNHGKILSPEEIKKSKNPNDVPPAVFFKYRKSLEIPDVSEGFGTVRNIKGHKYKAPGKNKAIILDYDGTLREVIGGGKYPTNPSQVKLIESKAATFSRTQLLKKFSDEGYLLLGASNQSGIAKGDLTESDARACFDRTNELLGLKIEYQFCPHRIPPLSCFCRKPNVAMGIYFIEKYGLNPEESIMCGDRTEDRTFAKRCGFQFATADVFFS